MGPDRSRERAFLEAALRAFLERAAPTLPAGPLDWEWMVKEAEAERLAALLYSVLHLLPIPPVALDRLRAMWVNARRQHLLGIEQLSGLLRAFDGEGIPALALKGPALGEALYADPGLRPFTDLDLLIRPADVPRAVSLLSALGYCHLDAGHRLSHEIAWRHAATFAPALGGHVPVDLHWALLDYPGLARPPSVDLGEIWSRALTVEGGNGPARILAPEDLLLYLALHWAVHHAFAGLVWRIDLALLLRHAGTGLDWAAVAERARRWRVAGALHFALRELEDAGRGGVPAPILARLRPWGARAVLLHWVRRRGGRHRERLDYLVPFLLVDRGRDVLSALARAALPPPNWLRSRYGRSSLPGAYLAHFGRLGRVCLRTMRASLAR